MNGSQKSECCGNSLLWRFTCTLFFLLCTCTMYTCIIILRKSAYIHVHLAWIHNVYTVYSNHIRAGIAVTV